MVKDLPQGDQGHKCCGILEEAANRSLERRATRREKPQPWIVLKFAVGLTSGIIAYAFYVYVGRFCVPMIRDNDGALGGRSIGIPFLVVFCLLGIMLWWSYIKVVITGPGKARDYVQKSSPPTRGNAVPRWWDSGSDLIGEPYIPVPQPEAHDTLEEGQDHSGSIGDATASSSPTREKRRQTQPEENVGVTDTLPPVRAAHARSEVNSSVGPPANGNQSFSGPPMMFTRKPSTTPVLLPEYRYCHKDGFIKPMRAHHCRACGTCILKYDHHCPWIGQCVGAHNHKFFVNFLQWAMWFCLWTFATLLAAAIKTNTDTNRNIDPQQIVIIALAGLFALFSSVLFFTHMRLILLNLSTLDSMDVSRMEEREKAVLSRLHSCSQLRAKSTTKRQWDEEWGSIATEGNIWWLGSYKKNWEAVMGHKILEWFLPIGHSDGDGVTYYVNPRFDKDGRWRPRREWPAELQ